MRKNDSSVLWPMCIGLLAIFWIGVFLVQSFSSIEQPADVAVATNRVGEAETETTADPFLSADLQFDSSAPANKTKSNVANNLFAAKSSSPLQENSQDFSSKKPSGYLDLVTQKTDKLLKPDLNIQKETILKLAKSTSQQSSAGELLAKNPLAGLLAKKSKKQPKNELIAVNPFSDIPASSKSTTANSTAIQNNADKKTHWASGSNKPKVQPASTKRKPKSTQKKNLSPIDSSHSGDPFPKNSFETKPNFSQPTGQNTSQKVEPAPLPKPSAELVPIQQVVRNLKPLDGGDGSNILVEIIDLPKPEVVTLEPIQEAKTNKPQSENLVASNEGSTSNLNEKSSSNSLILGSAESQQEELRNASVSNPNEGATKFATLPESLIHQVESLQNTQPQLASWCKHTASWLKKWSNSGSTAEAVGAIGELEEARVFLTHWIHTQDALDAALKNDLLVLGDRIGRQTNIWKKTNAARMMEGQGMISRPPVPRLALNLSGLDESWRNYLLVDQLTLIGRGLGKSQERQIASDVLARVFNSELDFRQARIVRGSLPKKTLSQLTYLSDRPFDFQSIYQLVEATEGQKAVDVTPSFSLNEVGRRLSFSPKNEVKQLGKDLNQTYRQDNLKVTLNSKFINLWLRHQDWYASLLGKTGSTFVSKDQSPFTLKMVPYKNGIRLQIQNTSNLKINSDGWKSSSDSSENDITKSSPESSWKSVPPSGINYASSAIAFPETKQTTNQGALATWLVDHYATKADSLKWHQNNAVSKRGHENLQARGAVGFRIGDGGVEVLPASSKPRTLENKTRRGITENITDARKYLAGWVDAFEFSGLEPKVFDAQSTTECIKANFRIGDHRQACGTATSFQLPKESILGIQIHQSLVMNILERCKLEGKRFTWGSFCGHLKSVIDPNESRPSNSIEESSFEFQLEEKKPVGLKIEKDLVKVTLRLKHLWIPTKTKNYAAKFDHVQITFHLNLLAEDWRIGWAVDPNRPIECHFYSLDSQDSLLTNQQITSQSRKICRHIGESIAKPVLVDCLPFTSLPNSLKSKLEFLPVQKSDGWVHFSIGKKRKGKTFRIFTRY